MFVLVYMYVHSNYDDRWVVQTDRQTDLFEQFIYILLFMRTKYSITKEIYLQVTISKHIVETEW